MDKDFRVCDVVCDFEFGDGAVSRLLNASMYKYPVIVDFGHFTAAYSTGGYRNKGSHRKMLFHGKHEDVFIVEEKKPIRKVKRWVNVYSEAGISMYDTKDAAVKYARDVAWAVAVEVEIDEHLID